MIDTHIHLDEEAYAPDREEVIARQREAGVEAMIVPGVNAASIPGILDVCRRHPHYCYPGLGFHPQDVKADWQEQWTVIEAAIRANRDELVAIGEIGLDYYWDTTYKAEQQELFRRQLALAQQLDLPVMIHSREATEDTLRILKEVTNDQRLTTNDQLRGVVHCFNGSRETAQQILDLGFYLGIGGVITFKNCKLADTLAELNSEAYKREAINGVAYKLLLETDGPYLAPTPHRGERNESRLMIHVAERLATALNTTPEEIIRQTTANARQLFALK